MPRRPQQQDPAKTNTIILNFIQELKQQTQGKVDPEDIDKLVLSGLGRSQSLILEEVISMGVELDLSNPDLCPDQSQCSIF